MWLYFIWPRMSASRGMPVGCARYNGAETDVSFCVVSNIIVAWLTRWQLVWAWVLPRHYRVG